MLVTRRLTKAPTLINREINPYLFSFDTTSLRSDIELLVKKLVNSTKYGKAKQINIEDKQTRDNSDRRS